MSIFADEDPKDKYVYVTVYYIAYDISENNKGIIVFDKESHIPSEVKHKAKEVRAKFLKPDFSAASEIAKESIMHTPDGKIYQSPPLYRENTLKLLLKQIKTDTHSIDINDENYGSLNSSLADGVFEAFNRIFLNPNPTIDDLLER